MCLIDPLIRIYNTNESIGRIHQFKNKQVLVFFFFSDKEIIYYVEICLYLMFKVEMHPI